MTVLQLKEVLAGLPDGMVVRLNTDDPDGRNYDCLCKCAFKVSGYLVLADEVPTIPKDVPVVLFPKEEA